MTGLPSASSNRQNPAAHPDYLRVYVIGVILAMLVVYGVMAARQLSDPADQHNADFIHFYAAAQIARRQGYAQIYDLDLQRQLEGYQFGFQLHGDQFLPFNHPPYILPLLAILISDSYPASLLVWMLVLSGLILASLALLNSTLPKYPRPWRELFTAGLVCLPVYASIAQGQDTAFLLLGSAIFLWGMTRRREMLAGAGLSLLTLRPQIALFFILPLFIWSRPAFKAYVLSCALLALASLWMLGRQGTLDFIHTLRISSGGEGYGMNETGMFNLLGLLRRLLPGLDAGAARLAAWGFFLLAAVGIGAFFAFSKLDFERKFGLGLLLALMASPHLHYHDLTLLLIPAVILVREFCRDNPERLRMASALTASAGLLSMLSNRLPPVYYGLPYLLVGVLAFGLIRLPGPILPASQPVEV